MKKILLATNNPGKVQEFKSILKDTGYEIYSLKDLGLESVDIEENSHTLKGNALLKAQGIKDLVSEEYIVIADDTGLFVEALNGQPGVNSARYGGDHDDEKNRKKLLDNLKGKENRYAKFETVIAMVGYGDQEVFVKGILPGEISHEEKGDNGFGYDSIFIADSYKESLAQLSMEEKNSISHRRRAIEKLLEILK